MRTVVAQFSANQLLSQRDQVSDRIRNLLSVRAAHFNIIIDNVAITELTFMREYLEAIESKQVAQQEAERAKYEVEQAKEAKKSIIIQAEASSKSIELVGLAAANNPCKIELIQLILMSGESSILRKLLMCSPKPRTTSCLTLPFLIWNCLRKGLKANDLEICHLSISFNYLMKILKTVKNYQ